MKQRVQELAAGMARFEVVVGRIETLAVDAVVNAANQRLAPGTGVDGALRAAAGPELTHFTSGLGPISVGQAVMTPGFSLPARYIIHTAAPIFFSGGTLDERISGLARCYDSSISLAAEHALTSIAFPCLGTGNFGWPRDIACETAIEACRSATEAPTSVAKIVFCCFSEADAEPYRAELN